MVLATEVQWQETASTEFDNYRAENRQAHKHQPDGPNRKLVDHIWFHDKMHSFLDTTQSSV
jgi:hypothetical protein